MAIYLIPNGPMQTTAAFAAVTTGTTIKTLLQVKPSATIAMWLVGWGVSFDGSAAAAGIKVECIETDVAATVTATASADITKWDGDALAGGDPTTNLIQVGTTGTGYTGSAEGSITAVRNLDIARFLQPTQSFDIQFPLGVQPLIQVAKFARIRVTAGAAVNAYCYMLVRV